MKLGKIYDFVVRQGMEQDPRGKKVLEDKLEALVKEYNESKDKESFDVDSLSNPYADTRILYGDKNSEIKNILVGIDIEVAEILLADRLRQDKKKIDLIISHHPSGKALASLYQVMDVQVDLLERVGMPVNFAQSLMDERIDEVKRRFLSVNHMRSPDAAKLLDIPFMCAHTPADNFAYHFVTKLLEKEKPATLADIVSLLKKVPEYKEAEQNNCGPRIILGSPKAKAGKIIVDMTGGTEGSKDIFERLSQLGVSTIVAMHLSEEHFKKAKDARINAVIAGHISSDTLGLNLLFDRLEKLQDFKLISCSGFRRIKR
ncbi:MAG: NGG1p interacting factor NIF3 [Candidatus Omnitrophota bacterium]